MHLINNQLLHRLFRLSGVTPVEIVEHHPPMITLLPVGLFSPDALLRHRPCIRIQKHFCFIINQPFFRDVRPVHPIGVLKIVNIQTEHDHRIYPPDPVIFRKRNRPVRLFFPSVKQQLPKEVAPLISYNPGRISNPLTRSNGFKNCSSAASGFRFMLCASCPFRFLLPVYHL